ncbi:Retrovirus-related Pol polyprotein from transposon RE2 [Senna tora]|uniref:Retrovirus-related Pol polyprotein from transposon RE2 n=1 Tax=Senna tora TaxID=362788 RepID=A0A834W138_9FABA|nr:Retrovirus-related Pol polyprotein from transposon RE2 [Senna tora]
MTIVDYFGRLEQLWDELSNFDPVSTCKCGGCTCNITTTLEKKREDERVHTFLLGLDDNLYGTVRSIVLAQDPLPSVNKVYSILIQEERVKTMARAKDDQVEVMALATRTRHDSRDKNMVCSHCKKTGHDSANCFALVGYPEWWGDRPRGDGKGSGRATPQDPMTNNNAEVSTPSADQLGRGHRRKDVSVRLRDFVTHTIQVKSPSASSPPAPQLSSGTLYPIANYVACNNFSTRHRAFLAALSAETEPEFYSQALPPGFQPTTSTKVCRLRKSLYGLRQAPRCWFAKLSAALKNYGFQQSYSDYSLFTLHRGDIQLNVLVYVDDLIISGNHPNTIQKFKAYLGRCFHMKDLGFLKYFLGVEVARGPGGFFLCQRKYALNIVTETGLLGSRPASIPLEQNHRLALSTSALMAPGKMEIAAPVIPPPNPTPSLTTSLSTSTRPPIRRLKGASLELYMHVRCNWMVPFSNTKSDRYATLRAMDFTFGWFMEPVTTGDYPASMRSLVGKRLPKFSKQESNMLIGSFDFIGLNYYTANYAAHAPLFTDATPSSYLTDSRVNTSTQRDGIPIGIGSQAFKNQFFIYIYIYIYIGYGEFVDPNLSLEEALFDGYRAYYHNQHLHYLLRAIQDGANVKGYFVWSLMDDFEWDLDRYTTWNPLSSHPWLRVRLEKLIGNNASSVSVLKLGDGSIFSPMYSSSGEWVESMVLIGHFSSGNGWAIWEITSVCILPKVDSSMVTRSDPYDCSEDSNEIFGGLKTWPPWKSLHVKAPFKVISSRANLHRIFARSEAVFNSAIRIDKSFSSQSINLHSVSKMRVKQSIYGVHLTQLPIGGNHIGLCCTPPEPDASRVPRRSINLLPLAFSIHGWSSELNGKRPQCAIWGQEEQSSRPIQCCTFQFPHFAHVWGLKAKNIAGRGGRRMGGRLHKSGHDGVEESLFVVFVGRQVQSNVKQGINVVKV